MGGLITKPKALIVLDVPNIAMKHGKNKSFSCIGVKIVVAHYVSRGHKVIGFLPSYYTDYDRVAGHRAKARAGFAVKPQDVPDDVSMLVDLADKGTRGISGWWKGRGRRRALSVVLLLFNCVCVCICLLCDGYMHVY